MRVGESLNDKTSLPPALTKLCIIASDGPHGFRSGQPACAAW